MKCYACNYIHDSDKNPSKPWDTELCIEEGAKSFQHLITTVHIKTEANYGGSLLDEVNLYACPKCGTVRMERW